MFHKVRLGWRKSLGRIDRSQMVRGTLLDGFSGQVHEDGRFVVANPANLARRYRHLLARKPVTDLDDQLTNRPALGVHHKGADMADDPVARLEVVAAHGLRAPQMRIGTFGLRVTRSGWLARERFGWQLQGREAAHAPQSVTLPVVGPAVISVILRFVLSRHRFMRLNRRAVLNLFAGQIHEQELSGLMETAEGMGRDEHLAAG